MDGDTQAILILVGLPVAGLVFGALVGVRSLKVITRGRASGKYTFWTASFFANAAGLALIAAASYPDHPFKGFRVFSFDWVWLILMMAGFCLICGGPAIGTWLLSDAWWRKTRSRARLAAIDYDHATTRWSPDGAEAEWEELVGAAEDSTEVVEEEDLGGFKIE